MDANYELGRDVVSPQPESKGQWQRASPGSAASIGSKDQEPPWQVNASHAYRTSACQQQAHLKVSTGHGITDDGSAPRVGNTSMTPGDKRDPYHALTPAAASPTRAISKLSSRWPPRPPRAKRQPTTRQPRLGTLPSSMVSSITRVSKQDY